jgi:hypothetical protein
MHKESFIINCSTFLHVSTLLGHLQGELFVILTLRLHFIFEWECAVDCVQCTGGVNSLRSRPALTAGSAGRDRREFTPPKTTQYILSKYIMFENLYIKHIYKFASCVSKYKYFYLDCIPSWSLCMQCWACGGPQSNASNYWFLPQ